MSFIEWILGTVLVAIVVGCIYVSVNYECVKSHTELHEYVTQPIFVSPAKFVHLPIGGGEIRREQRSVCDQWEKVKK